MKKGYRKECNKTSKESKKVWNMLRNRNKTLNGKVIIKNIKLETSTTKTTTIQSEFLEKKHITEQETNHNIKTLKNGKSIGTDNIPNELIRYCCAHTDLQQYCS